MSKGIPWIFEVLPSNFNIKALEADDGTPADAPPAPAPPADPPPWEKHGDIRHPHKIRLMVYK
jgi:hypothetical protein